MDRKEKVLIYTVGTLAKLKDEGMVDGPDILTNKGKVIFDELQAEGFKPTEEEAFHAMIELQGYLINHTDKQE